jgi:hypothetical protein
VKSFLWSLRTRSKAGCASNLFCLSIYWWKVRPLTDISYWLMSLRVSVVILFLQFIRSELQLKKNMVFDVVAVVSTVHIGNILYCLYGMFWLLEKKNKQWNYLSDVLQSVVVYVSSSKSKYLLILFSSQRCKVWRLMEWH